MQACAISNPRFPQHGNSPCPIRAGTRAPVVNGYLTTEMHFSDIRRDRITSVHVTLSQIGFKRIFPLVFKPMFVHLA